MWWIYFDLPTEHVVERIRADFEEHLGAAFAWGYGHYFVFAAIAATGAGLVVAIDQLAGHSELTDVQAAFAFTLPVSLYVLSVWALHRALQGRDGGAQLRTADRDRAHLAVDLHVRAGARDRCGDVPSGRCERGQPIRLTAMKRPAPTATTRSIDAPRSASAEPTMPATASAATSPV